MLLQAFSYIYLMYKLCEMLVHFNVTFRHTSINTTSGLNQHTNRSDNSYDRLYYDSHGNDAGSCIGNWIPYNNTNRFAGGITANKYLFVNGSERHFLFVVSIETLSNCAYRIYPDIRKSLSFCDFIAYNNLHQLSLSSYFRPPEYQHISRAFQNASVLFDTHTVISQTTDGRPTKDIGLS